MCFGKLNVCRRCRNDPNFVCFPEKTETGGRGLFLCFYTSISNRKDDLWMSQTANKMATRPMFPLLMSMALPPMLSMLLSSLYNIVDSMFVARYAPTR